MEHDRPMLFIARMTCAMMGQKLTVFEAVAYNNDTVNQYIRRQKSMYTSFHATVERIMSV
jgi:hypothetical protein